MVSLFAILIFLVPVVMANELSIIRVYKKQDGSIAVLHVVKKVCKLGESEADCLERIAVKDCPRDANNKCFPHIDMDKSNLPPRLERARWRFIDPNDLSKGLTVDTTIPIPGARLEELRARASTLRDKAENSGLTSSERDELLVVLGDLALGQ